MFMCLHAVHRNSIVSAMTWRWSSWSPPKQGREGVDLKTSRNFFHFLCVFDPLLSLGPDSPPWWPFYSTHFSSLWMAQVEFALRTAFRCKQRETFLQKELLGELLHASCIAFWVPVAHCIWAPFKCLLSLHTPPPRDLMPRYVSVAVLNVHRGPHSSLLRAAATALYNCKFSVALHSCSDM